MKLKVGKNFYYCYSLQNLICWNVYSNLLKFSKILYDSIEKSIKEKLKINYGKRKVLIKMIKDQYLKCKGRIKTNIKKRDL